MSWLSPILNPLTKGYVKRIEHKYDSQLAGLRSSVEYIIASQAHHKKKSIEAVENLLKSIDRISDSTGSAVPIYRIMTDDELKALFQDRTRHTGILEKYKDLVALFNELHNTAKVDLNGTEELFVTPKLWMLYVLIRAAYGRLAFLTSDSLKNNNYKDWKNDRSIVKLFRNGLSNGQTEEGRKRVVGGFPFLANELRKQFVLEAQAIIHGRAQFEESVTVAFDALTMMQATDEAALGIHRKSSTDQFG